MEMAETPSAKFTGDHWYLEFGNTKIFLINETNE